MTAGAKPPGPWPTSSGISHRVLERATSGEKSPSGQLRCDAGVRGWTLGFAAAWCPLTLASCFVPSANEMWHHCLDLDKMDRGGINFISIYPGKGDTRGNGVAGRVLGNAKWCWSRSGCPGFSAMVGLCWLLAAPWQGTAVLAQDK